MIKVPDVGSSNLKADNKATSPLIIPAAIKTLITGVKMPETISIKIFKTPFGLSSLASDRAAS